MRKSAATVNAPRPALPVLVLGMHRSGTSCLTGCLEEAGLWLGSVNTAAPFNRKGNREHEALRDLQESILRRSGGAWDAPPAAVVWRPREKREILALLSGFSGNRRWGVKDPRSLLMLDQWHEILDFERVGTFRHPAEVASSLIRRAQAWGQPMEREAALSLWARYNRCLLDEYRRRPFPVLHFGAADYEADLRRAAKALDLDPPQRFSFFETQLRHERDSEPLVPSSLQGLWAELQACAARWPADIERHAHC